MERRFCDHCLTDIEDELHFLIQCPRYSHVRNTFFSAIVQNHCKFFLSLDDKSKFNWLLANSDDEVIIQLGSFVYECFEIHGK